MDFDNLLTLALSGQIVDSRGDYEYSRTWHKVEGSPNIVVTWCKDTPVSVHIMGTLKQYYAEDAGEGETS